MIDYSPDGPILKPRWTDIKPPDKTLGILSDLKKSKENQRRKKYQTGFAKNNILSNSLF